VAYATKFGVTLSKATLRYEADDSTPGELLFENTFTLSGAISIATTSGVTLSEGTLRNGAEATIYRGVSIYRRSELTRWSESYYLRGITLLL